MPSSTSFQDEGASTPLQGSMSRRSPSIVPAGGEINISLSRFLEMAQLISPPAEGQEAKAETIYSDAFHLSSKKNFEAFPTTEQTAITSSKQATSGISTASGDLMTFSDLRATTGTSAVISEGEINISVPVLSSLRGQDKGTQNSEGDFLDLFDNGKGYMEQPPNSPSERTTQELSGAAALEHDNEKAPLPAAFELKLPQEKPQRTMDVTEGQQDHKSETKRRSRKRRKAKKSTGSPKKSNERIDAADVSASSSAAGSWHSLTSAQRPVVKLPPGSTSYHQEQTESSQPQQESLATSEPLSSSIPGFETDLLGTQDHLPPSLPQNEDTAQTHNYPPEIPNLMDADDGPQPPFQPQQAYIVTNVGHRTHRRRIPVRDGQRIKPLTPPPPPALIDVSPAARPARPAPTATGPPTNAPTAKAPTANKKKKNKKKTPTANAPPTTNTPTAPAPTAPAPTPTTPPQEPSTPATLWDFCPCNIQGHRCRYPERCEFNPGLLCTVRGCSCDKWHTRATCRSFWTDQPCRRGCPFGHDTGEGGPVRAFKAGVHEKHHLGRRGF